MSRPWNKSSTQMQYIFVYNHNQCFHHSWCIFCHFFRGRMWNWRNFFANLQKAQTCLESVCQKSVGKVGVGERVKGAMGCSDNTTIGEQDEPRKPRIPRSFDQIDQVCTVWSNWILHRKLKYSVCSLIELFLFYYDIYRKAYWILQFPEWNLAGPPYTYVLCLDSNCEQIVPSILTGYRSQIPSVHWIKQGI